MLLPSSGHALFISIVWPTLTRCLSLTNARIVAFIYTHTHDEEGDLFYGNGFSSEDVAEVRPPETFTSCDLPLATVVETSYYTQAH